MSLDATKKDVILIVDDQPNNLKVISSVLGKEYSLSVANSGKNALQILERIKPNLILLDIMMPEMNGYEVCSIIKANSDLQDIPVIFLTAKSDIEDIVKGFDYGAVDYITKPFNIKEVRVRINNHLKLSHAREQILEQKRKIEDFNYQLLETQQELERRNEDLMIAQESVERHAHEVNIINQKLLESEYKLKESNEELTKTNLEKDKFFSIIAHDLRSPFSGLIGLLELMTEEMENLNSETRQEMIQSLLDSSKQVYTLLENLLEWSRLQRKKIVVVPQNLEIRQLISGIFSILSAQASAKSIALYNDVPELTIVYGDERMISTVIRNLLTNAIKFTYEEGRIDILLHDSSEKEITIAVKDNGIGMSEEIRSNLFKIGAKVSQHGTNKERGTGLGLVLCQEFADLNHGKLSVESEEGKGSTFYLTLPKGV
jgi:two-component system sensor histidine kinase/response regulator